MLHRIIFSCVCVQLIWDAWPELNFANFQVIRTSGVNRRAKQGSTGVNTRGLWSRSWPIGTVIVYLNPWNCEYENPFQDSSYAWLLTKSANSLLNCKRVKVRGMENFCARILLKYIFTPNCLLIIINLMMMPFMPYCMSSIKYFLNSKMILDYHYQYRQKSSNDKNGLSCAKAMSSNIDIGFIA